MAAWRCWWCRYEFARSRRSVSASSNQFACPRCGEFTDRRDGGPFIGDDREDAPSRRPASIGVIAEHGRSWDELVKRLGVKHPHADYASFVNDPRRRWNLNERVWPSEQQRGAVR